MALEDLLVSGYIQRIEAVFGPLKWEESGLGNGSKLSRVFGKGPECKRLRAKAAEIGLLPWPEVNALGPSPQHVMAYIAISEIPYVGATWHYTPEGW